MSKKNSSQLTFWGHIEELRKILFKSLAVVAVFTIVAFVCKNILFDILLAPSKSDFVTYRLFCVLGQILHIDICPKPFDAQLISTQLASQFMIHLSISFYAGILVALPYILYQLFRFISPALYENEQKYSSKVLFFSFFLFATGVLLNYFLIFPLSFRFLITYQTDEAVANMITLNSYVDTLTMLSLMIGLMTELPIIAWLLAKLNILSASFMRKYRRHVVVVLLIVAAIITPTADIFTLLLVFVPIYLLYEVSVVIVGKVNF
ncbi:MAG: twin-arginine translocase subunit TatC [Bacteroidales bacterium]|jgi:sec-independent protein translocase protein TatC|nr:twin-arginine translocase subunit TatC [Bacteroidales bacterium]